MSTFELLPIIVFGPGVIACVVLIVAFVRGLRRDRRRIARLEQLATEAHRQRAVLGPNVIPIWTAPSFSRPEERSGA